MVKMGRKYNKNKPYIKCLQVGGEELEVTEAGDYRCEATNSAGADTKTFTVLLGGCLCVKSVHFSYFFSVAKHITSKIKSQSEN